MPLQRFREVADRFSHIDGRIVATEYRTDAAGSSPLASVTVRFYTWWEHPAVAQAMRAGEPWGWAGDFDAEQDMRIEARGVRRFERNDSDSAIDLLFATDHPALWEFDSSGEIMCNGKHDPRALIRGLLTRRAPSVDESVLLRYLNPFQDYTPPYSLGLLPRPLFRMVREELEAQGVPMFAPREPAAAQPLEVLQLDDSALLVAEEIWVQVPEWEQRPEWFRPPAG
jgi:hypothetical protein